MYTATDTIICIVEALFFIYCSGKNIRWKLQMVTIVCEQTKA